MSFETSILARGLRGLARAVCRRPKWWIYPQIVLSGLCLLYTLQGLKLDMNRDSLVGAGARYHQIYMQFRREFPGEDQQLVLAESAQPERNRQFIERLAARLQPQTNLFSGLFYKADLTTLGRKGLLLAPTDKLEQMRQSLHDYVPALRDFTQATNLDSLFSTVNRQFRTGGRSTDGRAEALVGAVPMLERIIRGANQSASNSLPPVAPDLEQLLVGKAGAEPQSYLTTEQGRIFLLTVRPRSEAVETRAVESLRQAIARTQTEVPGVNVGLTGGLVLNYDEMRQSERDSLIATAAALVVCSLIFIIAYGEVDRPLKAAFCLLVGFGYTLGWATLTVGHLNILSVTFAPMLVGLGIDFGVHFISRYEEEMRNHHTVAEAIQRASAFTGQGIVVGALTTAAAFLAMGLTRFQGVREVGLICGGGLLLCLVPMLTMLPALLMVGRENARDAALGPGGQARVQIERVWLQHPLAVLGVTLLLCAVAATALGRVYFDYDLLHMQNRHLASVRSEEKLIQSSGGSFLFAAVVADSPQQARAYEAKIEALPAVARVDSVARYLTQAQQQKLQQVRAIQHELAGLRFAPPDRGLVNLDDLSATLYSLNGYLAWAQDAVRVKKPVLAGEMRSLQQAITEFRKTLMSGQPQIPHQLSRYQMALFQELNQLLTALQTQDTSGPLRAQDLPPVLRERFIGVTGKYLLQVYPRENLWQHDHQLELMQQLQSVVPPDRVTGVPIQMYQNTTRLKRSYEQAAWYSLGAIALMLFLHFRSPGSVLLALLPVGLGSLWVLGFMGSFGVPFNPANIMTVPLVVGIGVTNGIQILNRFAEEQRPSLFARSTGKAVLVSGLTAIAGFGALLLAKHQGIQSLGQIMSAGIAACMVAALTVLPALLSLLMRRPRAMRFVQELRPTPSPGWEQLQPHRP